MQTPLGGTIPPPPDPPHDEHPSHEYEYRQRRPSRSAAVVPVDIDLDKGGGDVELGLVKGGAGDSGGAMVTSTSYGNLGGVSKSPSYASLADAFAPLMPVKPLKPLKIAPQREVLVCKLQPRPLPKERVHRGGLIGWLWSFPMVRWGSLVAVAVAIIIVLALNM